MGTDAKVVVRLSIEERLMLEKVLQEPRGAKDRVFAGQPVAEVGRRRTEVAGLEDRGGVRCQHGHRGSAVAPVRI